MSDPTPTPTPDPTPTPTPDPTPTPTPEAAAAEDDRPDWLPEKFWDAEKKKPAFENLAKSYRELESTRGKDLERLQEEWRSQQLAARPETPDAYQLPENDALDTDALAASPIVGLWRRAAHEAGLGQEQFAAVIEDYAKTQVEQVEAARTAELEKLGENAAVRTHAVANWARSTFQGEELAAVAQIATTAAGVKVLEKLMGKTIESSSSDGGDDPAQTDGPTEKEIRALMNTPEYFSPSKRDPAVVAKVEAFFQAQYGKKK